MTLLDADPYAPLDAPPDQVLSQAESVLWHVGQYVDPRHFQTTHREIMARIAAVRRLALPHPYGIIESRLAADALANRLVRFERLRAVMPSGLEVDVPADTDLPALTIEQQLDEPLVVYLAVPLWQEARANIEWPDDRTHGDDGDDARGTGAPRAAPAGRPLYSVIPRTRRDENTGEDPREVLVRRTNARLLLDSDDKSDMEYLPVLRVLPSTGSADALPADDPAFVPPCLLLRAARALRARAEALASRVEAERAKLDSQLAAAGALAATVRPDQFERFLRLSTLSTYAPRLRHLADQPGTTPAQLYLELRGLLGQLAALVPGTPDRAVPRYDHDRPSIPFAELFRLIPPLLAKAGPPVWSVPFTRDGGLLVAQLTPEQVTAPVAYLLAIQTTRDGREVRDLVEDAVRFRCDSRDKLRGLLVVRGIEMEEERAPEALASPPDVHYYRLLRTRGTHSAMAWENIQRERVMALRWADMETSDFRVTLHMILPDPNAPAASPNPQLPATAAHAPTPSDRSLP
jgi:type VI secretion system protein ImpJ